MNRKISESDKRPLVPQLPTETVIKQIGAGGTGAIVARYGLLLLASLVEAQNVKARWVVIDGDQFEPSNRTRTAFPCYGNKAEVVVEQLVDRLESAPLTLTPITEYVTETNIERLLHDGDMVLVCVDNHATRKLVSDYCGGHLNEFAIISGGNDAIGEDRRGRYLRGTYGNCQIYLKGRYDSPSLTHYHPEIATPGDRLPSELDCTERLASEPQNLLANLAVASSMLNALWLHWCHRLHYSELAFDIADGVMRPLDVPPPRRVDDP